MVQWTIIKFLCQRQELDHNGCMPTIFHITEETLTKFAKKVAIDVVHKTTDQLYLEVQKLSPIRTGEYASWHRNMWVRIVWDQCIWEIKNTGSYPERVEFWFWKWGWIWNRQTAVNWHLRNGTIYHDKWAHTYKKSLLKVKPFFNQLLKW